MFADLNKHAVRPSTSIATLYDHREALSNVARHIMTHVKVFSRLTEVERASISNRSTKLFTLSAIKSATQALLSKKKNENISENESELAAEFWQFVCDQMEDWRLASERQLQPAELRSEYIHSHGLALHAIGMIGSELIHDRASWVILKGLSGIDWSRHHKQWTNRALSNGRVSKSSKNIRLTANLIKTQLGLALTEKQKELENGFNN